MHEAITTHFQSQTISTTGETFSELLVITEMVRTNQVLVSRAEKPPAPSTTLIAGDNCSLSDDSTTVTAQISGYPNISQSSTNGIINIKIEVLPVINVADDKMLATLSLYPHLPGTPALTLEDILTLCKEQGISCGIDMLAIDTTIERVEQDQRPMFNIPIARGLLPVAGNDAYLRFAVEIGPLPGKILQDGSIDWRERKIFIGIDKDELIATRIPPTEGTAGTDIQNNPIQQKPGKDITVRVAGDVQYLEESGEVLATSSGVLSVVNETDVKVSAKQTIAGNVDFSVGNIESHDGLEIKGDVKPGFLVSCKGDLFIGGNIHSATIHAKGNSKIANGLMGESSQLIADGDVEISFVERAKVASGGAVILTKGAYYADIRAKKRILCRPAAKIVGGTFCSSSDVIGGIIGSCNATPALIAAGVDLERFHQRDKLLADIRAREEELKNLIQKNGQRYAKASVYQKKEAALQQRINNFRKLNLIPDSPLYSRHSPDFSYCSATISVQGQIFSGTRIRIGNTSTTLEEDTSAIRFHIERRTGHIVATPYNEEPQSRDKNTYAPQKK